MTMKTISFELAKRLNELGVRKLAYFEWLHLNERGIETIELIKRGQGDYLWNSRVANYLAYTLDEILEMLPHYSLQKGCFGSTEVQNKTKISFRLDYDGRIEILDEHVAEAAGELLAWCIENKHVTFD